MALSNYDPGQDLSSIDFSAVIGGPLAAIVDAQSNAALSTVDFIKSVGFTPDTTNEAGEVTPGTPIYVTFKYPKLVQPYQPKVFGKLNDVTVENGGSGYVEGDVLTISPETGEPIEIVVTEVETGGEIDFEGIEWNSNLTGYDNSENETEFSAIGGSGSGAVFKIVAGSPTEAVPAIFQEMQLEVPILTMLPIPFIRVEEGEIDFHAKITSAEFRDVSNTLTLGASLEIGRSTEINVQKRKKRKVRTRKTLNSLNFKASVSYQRSARSGHKIDKTYHLGVRVRVAQDEMPEGMEKLLGILEDAIVSTPVIEEAGS